MTEREVQFALLKQSHEDQEKRLTKLEELAVKMTEIVTTLKVFRYLIGLLSVTGVAQVYTMITK